MSQPSIHLHTLTSTDGSATYTSPTSSHTITSGISYPLEVQFRSKELPEDTYIEVILIPHNAVSQVKERHVEEVVRRVLKSIVRGEETPRCMLQCTLQVTDAEVDESLPGGVKGPGQGGSYLEMLAGAVNCAVAGCLDGGVQMRSVAGAVVVAVMKDGRVRVWPTLKERKLARSLHVFAFNTDGHCLLMESEGSFEVEEWERAGEAARRVVTGSGTDADVDVDMNEDTQSLLDVMRRAVEARVEKDGSWKDD